MFKIVSPKIWLIKVDFPTPEEPINAVVSPLLKYNLKTLGVTGVSNLEGCEENMVFEVPKELRIHEVK